MGLSPVSLLLFLPFFFVDIATFLNIEHDTALLHMSTYIAERWHRAHGFCMCRGGEAPFVRNSTTTTTTTHTHTHTQDNAQQANFSPKACSLQSKRIQH